MQRKRDRGRDERPRCVDSGGKKRGAWFIALAGLHSASRSRRTNLGPDPEFECASQLRVFHAKVKDTRTRFRSFFQPSRARARARYSKSLTCDSSISARLRLTRERGLFIRRAFPGVRPLNPFFSSKVSGNFA